MGRLLTGQGTLRGEGVEGQRVSYKLKADNDAYGRLAASGLLRGGYSTMFRVYCGRRCVLSLEHGEEVPLRVLAFHGTEVDVRVEDEGRSPSPRRLAANGTENAG